MQREAKIEYKNENRKCIKILIYVGFWGFYMKNTKKLACFVKIGKLFALYRGKQGNQGNVIERYSILKQEIKGGEEKICWR